MATEDGELPRTWNVLASRFLGRARFGVVNTEIAKLMQESEWEQQPITNLWKVRIYQAKTKMRITYYFGAPYFLTPRRGLYRVRSDADFAMVADALDRLVPPKPMSVWRKISRKLKQFWKAIWRVY